jgi:hypothetical protein
MTEIDHSSNALYVKAGNRHVPLRVIRNVVLGLTLVVLGFGLGHSYKAGAIVPNNSSGSWSNNGLSRDNLDFTLFWEVWDRLERVI